MKNILSELRLVFWVTLIGGMGSVFLIIPALGVAARSIGGDFTVTLKGFCSVLGICILLTISSMVPATISGIYNSLEKMSLTVESKKEVR